MATNAEIQAWLAANPNATDAQIAAAMKQFGITANQLSSATGVPVAEITARQRAVASMLPTNITATSGTTSNTLLPTPAGYAGNQNDFSSMSDARFENEYTKLASLKSKAENNLLGIGAGADATNTAAQQAYQAAGGDEYLRMLNTDLEKNRPVLNDKLIRVVQGKEENRNSELAGLILIATGVGTLASAGAGGAAAGASGTTATGTGGATTAGTTGGGAGVGGAGAAAGQYGTGGFSSGTNAGTGGTGIGEGYGYSPTGLADAERAALDAFTKKAGGSTDPNVLQQALDWTNKTFGTNYNWGDVAGGLLQTGGSLLNYNAATGAAQDNANAQVEAARIAAEAAKFRPVGVTTSFGSSRFGYDDKGNLTSAGYDLSPEARAQQAQLYGMSNQALTQMQGAGAATAPMGTTAQTMFNLGQGYLSTSPQQQAQKYMADQQALLAAPRADSMAKLQTQLNNQGRGGLSMGGNAGMMATNPEMAAYYNSLAQQDLGLAANATQGGMDYSRFGAGMAGLGGDMLNNMYSTQNNAYTPYGTLLGGIQKIEGLGQNTMDLGVNIGARGTASNAQAGQLLANGMTNAANTMLPVNSASPWGTLLSGAGSTLGNYKWGQ